MEGFFDNGATRARAWAWARWLLLGSSIAAAVVVFGRPVPWIWPCLLAALGAGACLLLIRLRPRKLPVLNYHSVSARPGWLRSGERDSIAPETFERQLAHLRGHGYETLFVSEARAFLAGGGRAAGRGRRVALTFDDGYADNWVAAFPLLKKYGMKATVFVSTGFVADAERCRETIEGKRRAEWEGLDWEGYLTWSELKTMRASGLVEIQAHGHEHTRVFADAELKGFVGPGRPNLWLFWNKRPEARGCWWREIDADRSLWGHPVFRQKPALAHRAFRPDPTAVAHMLSWARGVGADAFSTEDWARSAREEWERYGRGHAVQGEWESVEEYEGRIEQDLTVARRILREKLGVESDVLCWPENAFSEVSERVARRAGYAATVSNRHNTTNTVGEAPDQIVRTFIGSPAAGIRSALLDLAAFVLERKVFEGWYILYPPLVLVHAARKIALGTKRHCACRKDSF